MEKTEDIILFDMDGTLCDYDKALFEVMKKLKFPKEPDFDLPIHDDAPEYLKARSDLIKSSEKWRIFQNLN